MQNQDKRYSELELKIAAKELITRPDATNAHVHVPRKDLDYVLGVGLRMLTLRQLVDEADGPFAAKAEARHVRRYYANSISHLL